MKRPNRSDPLAGAEGGELISTTMCLSGTEEELVYGKRVGSSFHSILDGLGEAEDQEIAGDGDDLCSQGGGLVALGEKKRRLNIEQVKALEKNFEVENKLEPERKVKLAQELGLQPRQVAVWFQNRRARWKTKQLERDYGVLMADYDALKHNHDNLKHEHDALLAEIKELKAKLVGDGESYGSTKEEPLALPPEEQSKEKKKNEMSQDVAVEENEEEEDGSLPALIYKDGSSDSDTSAILNDDGSGAISSSSGIMSHHHLLQQQQQMLFMGFDCSSPSSTFDGRLSGKPSCSFYQHQQQDMEMEEHDFLHGTSSFFSDEQAPTLTWYCSDQWNSEEGLDI